MSKHSIIGCLIDNAPFWSGKGLPVGYLIKRLRPEDREKLINLKSNDIAQVPSWLETNKK